MLGKSYFHRSTCRLCESSSVELVVPLAPIPLPDKYVTKDQLDCDTDVYPVDLYICNDCGHVQLLDVIYPEVLWDSDFSFHSGMSPGLVKHFEGIVKNIVTKYNPERDSLVLDIGSNDGSMLMQFKDLGYKVLGVDPVKEIAQKATASGIETLPCRFTFDEAKEIKKKFGSAKIITAFNVFAHADDMGDMAEAIRHVIGPDGIFQFETQYLLDTINNGLLGTIFHEHLCYHSVKPLIKFLYSHGLELIDVKNVTIQRGSIIGTVQRIGGPYDVSPSVQKLVDLENKERLDNPEKIKQFLERLNRMKDQAKELSVKWKREGATVAGYGAARSGPTFISQLGLGETIKYIFDDHPQKVHKYTPGHHIPVIPTNLINKYNPEYVIILAWVHSRNIIRNNIDYINNGGRFVVCFPEVEVVNV